MHDDDFNEVKKVLSSLPLIKPPRWEATFYVCPSVGTDAFGVVLLQKDDETLYMQPIYFASKTMTLSEKGYSDVEQMMFALVFATRKFRPYLLFKAFVILIVDNCFPFCSPTHASFFLDF